MVTKKPPAILLYIELWESDFKRLDDAEIGKIATALVDFLKTGEIKTDAFFNNDRALLGAYDRCIEIQMQNVAKYGEYCKHNSYNAYKKNHPAYSGTYDEYITSIYNELHKDDTNARECERMRPDANDAKPIPIPISDSIGDNEPYSEDTNHTDYYDLPFG